MSGPEFNVGARVAWSEEAFSAQVAAEATRRRTGTVVGRGRFPIPTHVYKYSGSATRTVRVLWDGCKSIMSYHPDFLVEVP